MVKLQIANVLGFSSTFKDCYLYWQICLNKAEQLFHRKPFLLCTDKCSVVSKANEEKQEQTDGLQEPKQPYQHHKSNKYLV